jgi:hypothetical protein
MPAAELLSKMTPLYPIDSGTVTDKNKKISGLVSF